MDITGKIIAALPPRTGTSAKGGWQSNGYVLETQEQFPRKVAFEVFGLDEINKFNIQIGEFLTVSIDIDAHEYNGRWFNSVRVWNVSRPQAQQPAYGQPTYGQPAPPIPPVQQGAVFAQPAPQSNPAPPPAAGNLPF